MSLFPKNPNEALYTGGKKHFADVIKNSGPGETLIWLNPEEDFNTNSTLIVAESEEALFFKDGIVEQVFDGGKYTLSTENYPFISRLRNMLTGGVSTFNCKVYFVRKASSMEIYWGTDSPIQVRDPVQQIATSVQARGAYKIRVDNGKKFLIKLVGNNVITMAQEEIDLFFRSELLQGIKSTLARAIQESREEILGICAKQDVLAKQMQPMIQEILNEYGLRLLSFSIAGLDIPENDPNRQRLENAYATKREAEIYGRDYGRFVARELLTDVATNPGAGGVASMGAGIGMGVGTAPIFAGMAQQLFSPINMQEGPAAETPPQAGTLQAGSRFVQKSAAGVEEILCPACGAKNGKNSKFCAECGTALIKQEIFCGKCGAKLSPGVKFCSECGMKLGD